MIEEAADFRSDDDETETSRDPREILRRALADVLSRPAHDPEDRIDVSPPPEIPPETLAEIPALASLEEVVRLDDKIQRNTNLQLGIEEVTLKARKLEQLREANAAKRCEHIRHNGKRCGSPAMSLLPYCYYHERANTRVWTLTLIEDRQSLLLAHTRLAEQVINESVRPEQARVLLQILQSAASNLPPED